MANPWEKEKEVSLESSIGNKVKTVYFVALAALMHYFLTQILDLGIYISYRHIFALLMINYGCRLHV